MELLNKIESIKSTKNPHPVSGHTLQLLIGCLAFSFPTVLIIGAALFSDCNLVQGSISAYYHTIMKDFFVGVLCAISFGLFCYYGYSRVDNIAANLAAFFILGVAFFPVAPDGASTCMIHEYNGRYIFNVLHYICASLTFVILAFFSLFLFTKSEKGVELTHKKRIRNRIFRTCGFSIVGFILLMIVYFILPEDLHHSLSYLSPVFFLETLSLLAFSLAWLVKSKLIFGD